MATSQTADQTADQIADQTADQTADQITIQTADQITIHLLLISGNREQFSLNVMQGRRHVPHRVVAFSPEGQDLEAGFCKGYAFKYVMDCL